MELLMPSGMGILPLMNAERRLLLAFHTWKISKFWLREKPTDPFSTGYDVKDKTLGAQAGSSGYLDFEAQPDLLKNRVKDQKVNQYQSFNEALIDLKNDRIDALLIDRVYANYYLQSEGILNDYNVFSAGFESESFAVLS